MILLFFLICLLFLVLLLLFFVITTFILAFCVLYAPFFPRQALQFSLLLYHNNTTHILVQTFKKKHLLNSYFILFSFPPILYYTIGFK